jgi:hypothetical protein
VFNGLEALDIIMGHWLVYFAAPSGRDPWFVYSIVATD